MTLNDWAMRHGVSPAAMAELRVLMLGSGDAAPAIEVTGDAGSEARQQSLVRLDAAQHGVWLTRNNVGALLDARGVPVRYGLANESVTQNRVIKSADLIGIRPILIGPQHVGTLIGQFVSREVKKSGWKFNPKDKHEVAQMQWCQFVLSKGGDAAFCTGPGTFNQRG